MEDDWWRLGARRWRELPERERQEFQQQPTLTYSFRFSQRKLSSEDEAILEQLSAQCSTQKDPKAELDFKQQGNARFRVKDYVQAVALYSKGLRHSCAASPQAALLYANRSAALYHLQRYQECLEDIRRAREHGYPQQLEHKILARHTSCLHYLAIPDKTSGPQDGGDFSDGGGQNTRATVLPSVGTGSQSQSQSQNSPCAQNAAATIVCEVSPALTLHSDTLRGRHLIASEELRSGEILLQEEAFAAVLIPGGKGKELSCNEDLYCHHCLGQTDLPLPCTTCSFSGYCTELCRQTAWHQYHWLECCLGGLLLALGTFAHLALRTVLVAGMQEVVKVQNEGDQNPGEQESKREDPNHRTGQMGCSGAGGFSAKADWMSKDGPSRYKMIHSLLTHTEQQKPKHRFLCAFTAAAVCRAIRQRGLETQLLSEELEPESAQGQALSTLGVALLQHMLQLQCNAQAITALRDTGVGNSHVAEMEEIRIATAFYSGMSLLNHSCDPNTSITFRNTVITVRASRPIPAGQEVLHCYGPHWSRMAVKERQRALYLQYFFQCWCTACISEEKRAARTESLLTQYLCFHCGFTLQDTEEADCKCSNSSCGHLVSKLSLTQQVQQIISKMDIARGLSAKNPDAAFQILFECQQTAQNILSSQHPVQGEIEDCLAQLYASQADWSTAAGHLRRSCELVSVQFGNRSVELAKQLFKLAQTLFNGQVVDEALSVIEQAECLFSLHCGSDNEMLIELKEMKSCLQPLASISRVTAQHSLRYTH